MSMSMSNRIFYPLFEGTSGFYTREIPCLTRQPSMRGQTHRARPNPNRSPAHLPILGTPIGDDG
jgi:hypothetical protein